jgi:GNAT superfamily N-acetyltransferase
MTLKIADYSDFKPIFDMAGRFQQASPYTELTYDEGKVVELIDSFLTGDRTQKIIILGLKDQEPVGMIAGVVNEMLFSHDLIASELMWWVEPEHRGSRLSIQLLDAYEEWARRVGAKVVQLSSVNTDHADKLDRLYRHRDYNLVERGYIKGLQ